MKFRMIWLGPDDEPNPKPPNTEDSPGVGSSRRHYQKQSTGMVRWERFANGWRIIPLTSFSAQIVADRIWMPPPSPDKPDKCLPTALPVVIWDRPPPPPDRSL
jgi:hypothetical protein